MARKLLSEPNLASIRPALHRDLRAEDLRPGFRPRDVRNPPPEEPVEFEPAPLDDYDDYEEESRSRGGWIGGALFLLAFAFLAFLAGAYLTLERLPPYGILKAADSAARAVFAQQTDFDDPLKTDLWADARGNERGVTIYDAQLAYSGPTLFTSGHDSAAYLVDMSGRLLHSWRLPFSAVWDNSSVVRRPRPDAFVYFDKVYMFPNGDLLAVYIGVGDTPWGLGLVKMDRNSRVIWKYLDRAHHDVEVGPDGRVYTLTQTLRNRPVDGMPNLETPMLEDFLVVLSPDGAVERKISLLDAVAASPYRKYFAALSDYARQDPLHTNAAKPVSGFEASNIGAPASGGVLLSFRETGLLATIDPETGRLVWATRGPWLGQHDPSLLPTGNILLFDNLGNIGPGGISRVVEFNPRNSAIEWSFAGTEDHQLESELRAGQQRLPNGNTLITESDGGRLLEVTRSGQIVWEYVNPIRGGAAENRIPVVSSGRRYAWSELDPGFIASWGTASN